VAREGLRSREAVLHREGAFLDRLETQISARRERVVELTREQQELERRTDGLREESDRLRDRLETHQGKIDPAEEQLARIGRDLRALDEQERKLQGRMRDAEVHWNQAKLEVDRREDKLRLLAERIEEDLGLVELELADNVTAQTTLPLRPLVSELPVVEAMPAGLEDEIQRLKAALRRLRGVNPQAPEEYRAVKDRHQFLVEQSHDLETATVQLHGAVAELDDLMETAFLETFEAVAKEFTEIFPLLFDGGGARLELLEPDDIMHAGVEIVAQPPGKRAQRLNLLSGGERALTATALLFALLRVSPTPFCVLDEVDAMLDEANVARFRGLLEDLAKQTQFVVITHNRVTIEAADTIYGVSMGADGASQVVSLKLSG
jgi:chromosome segregation protein